MHLYKLVSLLLDYPDGALLAALSEIRMATEGLAGSDPEDRRAVSAFLDYLNSRPLMDLQADYVQTFDLTPDNTLHLTHHLYEEQDRERGITLAALIDHFKRTGLELDKRELPDYLPLLLEYASTLEDSAVAAGFLGQMRGAVSVIAENLEKVGSPYASLLRIVEGHGRAADVQHAAIA